jgi:gamma-glutamyltranspeptidase/glutathione hydrolase
MLRGFSPQQAVDAPRFCISAGLGDAEVSDINSIVFFEDTFDPDVVAKLQGKSISPYEQ